MLAIESVEVRVGIVEVPVSPSGFQPSEGEAVIHRARVGTPLFVPSLVDPALISDEEKRRELVVPTRCQVGGHLKLAAPVRLALLNIVYGYGVDRYALGAFATLPEDRQIGGEADFLRYPPERDGREI